MRLLSVIFSILIFFQVNLFTQTPSRILAKEGVTVTIPDGWKLFSKDSVQLLSDKVRELFPALADQSSPVVYMIYDDSTDEFWTNINLVVTPEEIPIEENSVTELKNAVREQFSQMGIQIENVTISITELGQNKCIQMEYSSNSQFDNTIIRQYFFKGIGKSYIFTFTTLPSVVGRYEPIVAKFFTTMTIEAKPGIVDYWNELPKWLKYGIIGAIVALVFSLLSSIFRRVNRPVDFTSSGADTKVMADTDETRSAWANTEIRPSANTPPIQETQHPESSTEPMADQPAQEIKPTTPATPPPPAKNPAGGGCAYYIAGAIFLALMKGLCNQPKQNRNTYSPNIILPYSITKIVQTHSPAQNLPKIVMRNFIGK